MEWPGVVAGNFALSFSVKFVSTFVHISGFTEPITLIWLSETEANASHGRLRPAQESIG